MTVTVKGVQVELTPVESSNVAGVGFIATHSETCSLMQPPKVEYFRGGARLLESPMAVGCSCTPIGTLVVQFKSGAAYTYRNVPKGVHAALMASKSKGKYLQTYIVGNHDAYPFERVTEVVIGNN